MRNILCTLFMIVALFLFSNPVVAEASNSGGGQAGDSPVAIAFSLLVILILILNVFRNKK